MCCVRPAYVCVSALQPVQNWEPKEGFCDHSPIGGATEEDFYCTADMGLTQVRELTY